MQRTHRLLRNMLLLPAAALVLSLPDSLPAQESAIADEESDPIKLTYLFSDGNMSGTLAAWRQLLEERPVLEDRVTLEFLTESFFDSVSPGALTDSDIMVLDMMNQSMLDRYNETHDTDLIGDISAQGTVLAVGNGTQPAGYFTEQGAVTDERASAFWEHGGRDNQLGLLKYALRDAGVDGLEIPEPRPSLDFGYYYPDGGGGRVFADWQAFDDWRRARGKTGEGRPRVAIGFYKSSYYSNETAVIDAVIAEVERQGAEAIPFFGYPGHVAFERMLTDEQGNPRADVGLSLLLRFADFEATRRLEEVDIPLINLITLYGRSEQQWRESSTGLSLFEGTFQMAVPELAGLVAPTVVGSREKETDPVTNISYVVNRPIASRVETAVKRGLSYARLGEKPNTDKRVALMYYNYPVGKSNIGASYLNIAESLSNILQRMKQEGYDVGGKDLSAESLREAITTKARNVASFAPGELEEMIAGNGVEEIPVDTYRQWLDGYNPRLREKILADWGDPAEVELMARERNGRRYFIIPRLEYGNIILMPQPARGWSDDLEKLYHAEDLAPHHQYVAAYAWLRRDAGVDAIVHMGTHGTLEWLDGKDTGLSSADAPDALIADIPDIYLYNVDVVGEGLVARRRGMATLVDHMVPPFTKGDLYPELAELGELVNDFDNNLHKNTQLADAFAGQIIDKAVELGIDKSLGLDLAGRTTLEHDTVHEIRNHIVDMKEQFIPYGLHAFGRLPTQEMREATAEAVVSADRSLLPDQQAVLAGDVEQSIINSAEREPANLLEALDGRYIPGGNGGEPIRNPDVYPTGKNFYGIDPEKVPKKAAWELGTDMADQMLQEHLAEHGEYPRKLSFVIWGDETMRHEGIVESQIFYLLGTRPVWNERDKVVDVEVIPKARLGRPRIDIVIASAAEGMFNNVTRLMDKAVQKVKALEEAENYVREHYLSTKRSLMDMGYTEQEADRRAGVRIFDEPPGVYNLNTSNIAAASGSWNSGDGMANDYINKMGHGFGNGFWGEPMQDVFKLALQGVEKVVHSSSTTLYGALDNDDFYMYMGGLASAVRTVDGENPDMVVTNTRDPGNPEMSSLDKFIGTEFQTRYINPKWIEGMQSEGYAGARTMVEFVEYMWGWDATVDEVVDERMWQDTFEVYVQDRYDMDMEAFFDNNSPFAFQDMAARMLETTRKEYWDAGRETMRELLGAYVESVEEHGISCTEVSCGNPRLMEYVLETGAELGISRTSLENFRDAVEQAVKGGIEDLADAAENFARRNDARVARELNARPGGSPSLEGYRMEQISQQSDPRTRPEPAGGAFSGKVPYALQGFVLLMLLFWWQKRRSRVAGRP